MNDAEVQIPEVVNTAQSLAMLFLVLSLHRHASMFTSASQDHHQNSVAHKLRCVVQESVESFLEEVVVRRELSDNYCHYEPNYYNLKGAAQWAQDSLERHKSDKREYIYTRYPHPRIAPQCLFGHPLSDQGCTILFTLTFSQSSCSLAVCLRTTYTEKNCGLCHPVA